MNSHVLQHTQSFVLQHTKLSLDLSLSVNVSCTAVLQCVATHRAFCLATCCNAVCLCVAPHRALCVAARCNTVCLCVAAHCNTVICSTEFFLLQHGNGCNTGMGFGSVTHPSWNERQQSHDFPIPRDPILGDHDSLVFQGIPWYHNILQYCDGFWKCTIFAVKKTKDCIIEMVSVNISVEVW